MNIKIYNSPIEFQNNRPINKTYIELKRINAPSIIKWLISLTKNKEKNKSKSVSEFFSDFKDWMEKTKNKNNDISLNHFSRFLTADNEIFTGNEINKFKSSNMKITLNIDKIKEKLTEKNYINDDFDEYAFLD